jgi:hypothetical protein
MRELGLAEGGEGERYFEIGEAEGVLRWRRSDKSWVLVVPAGASREQIESTTRRGLRKYNIDAEHLKAVTVAADGESVLVETKRPTNTFDNKARCRILVYRSSAAAAEDDYQFVDAKSEW